MVLYHNLPEESQSVVKNWLKGKTPDSLYLGSTLDTLGVLSGYRDMAQYAVDESHLEQSSVEESGLEGFEELLPYARLIRDADLPHTRVYRAGSNTIVYFLYDYGSVDRATEFTATVQKDSNDFNSSYEYHKRLGASVGYPEFAIKSFDEVGWDEPHLDEQAEYVRDAGYGSEILFLLNAGVPYSIPVDEDRFELAIEDTVEFRDRILDLEPDLPVRDHLDMMFKLFESEVQRSPDYAVDSLAVDFE